MRLYEPPPVEAYVLEGDNASPTYAQYNYLSGSLAGWIKGRHFEWALRLVRKHLHRANAIDFGCADGVFLPSLARHFGQVVGVEKDPQLVAVAQRVTKRLGCDNVRVVCNEGLNPAQLRQRLDGAQYDVAFLLEVVEHVGTRERLYESKIAFVEQVASLLTPGGTIVISVPKMVGVSFLLQRIGLAALRLYREPLSMRNLLRAAFLRDTDELQRNWIAGYHLGFNHDRLEVALSERFEFLRRKSLPFQMVYVIRPK